MMPIPIIIPMGGGGGGGIGRLMDDPPLALAIWCAGTLGLIVGTILTAAFHAIRRRDGDDPWFTLFAGGLVLVVWIIGGVALSLAWSALYFLVATAANGLGFW